MTGPDEFGDRWCCETCRKLATGRRRAAPIVRERRPEFDLATPDDELAALIELEQIYPGRTNRTEQAFEEVPSVNDRRDPRSPAFRLGTIPNLRGPGVVELDPVCCHHGHPLEPGVSTRGWQPCGSSSHRGHRTWHCGHTVGGKRCGDLVQWPPASDACTPVGGYGTGSAP
jgi:hypothetical protein